MIEGYLTWRINPSQYWLAVYVAHGCVLIMYVDAGT